MSRQHLFAWWVSLLLLGVFRLPGQSITSFSPQLGAPGDTIEIFGTGFTGSTTVRFYNNKLAGIFVNSNTKITATVPSGVTTGPISVQNGLGATNYSPNDFTVTGPGPTITGFAPAYGAVNDQIIIAGVHFTQASVVKFNGVTASMRTINPAGTQITAFVPAGASTGPISVTTVIGTSNSPTVFTFIGPEPYITGFTPGSGNVGDTVTIFGFHFTGTTSVRFNGTNASFSPPATDTTLSATVPSGAMSGPITVVNASGSYTSSVSFYLPPQITGLAPAAGRVGTNVVITGASFTGTTAVKFNGLDATSFTVSSATQITATVPANATTGSIRVYTPGGTTPPGANFVVQPVISSFPSVGTIGQSIGLTGQNFWGATNVQFNGVNAAFINSVTYSSLNAIVPPGASTGPITLKTTNGTFTTASNFSLPANITSFSPGTGAAGTLVTILGNNFSNASSVKFHDASASFTVLSNGAISATAPAQVTTGPITVTAPAGVATSANNFFVAPIIINFAPTHGLPGTLVTITGTNFFGTTAVKLAGTNIAGFNIVNNGQITFTVPVGAVTGTISVVAPAGTATGPGVFTLDYSTDLGLTVTDLPDPVALSSNLVYTITITNRGLFAAPNVRLTNTLPAFVTIKSYTTSQGTVNTNANPVTAALGAIPVGTAAFVGLTVVPQAAGLITNLTTVTSDYPEANSADNSVVTITTVDGKTVLSIQSVPPNLVKISWPAPLSNSTLQFKPLLATTNFWSNVLTAPVIVSNQNVVTETNLGLMKFYRLQQ